MSDRTHQLKVWPEFFEALARREKLFELRYDDRAYRAGDLLLLREWDRNRIAYTGREMLLEVTYLTAGIGLAPGYVCMSVNLLPGYVCMSVNLLLVAEEPKEGKAA